MTSILAPFKNIEQAVLDLAIVTMSDRIPDATHTGTKTPATLADVLEFVRCRRVGGQDDRVTDFGVYDVDYFAPTYDAGERGAKILQGVLLGYPHRVGGTNGAGGVVIDYVFTERSPVELPWENEAIRRFGATYQLSARR